MTITSLLPISCILHTQWAAVSTWLGSSREPVQKKQVDTRQGDWCRDTIQGNSSTPAF